MKYLKLIEEESPDVDEMDKERYVSHDPPLRKKKVDCDKKDMCVETDYYMRLFVNDVD
jgi:hypothetical protein